MAHWATAAVQRVAVDPAPVVRVLTYHRFGDIARDPFCVTPEDFERQMAWLAEQEMAVSLADVAAFIHDGKSLKPGSILVTIDDGFVSVASHALPILKRHRIPAAVFVSSGNIGRTVMQGNQQGETPSEDYLDWRGLQELMKAGVDIGSHAVTHRSLARISLVESEAEIVESRASLERGLNIPITTFAYPYGTLADFNEDIATVLRNGGYQLAFTSQHGAIRAHSNAMTLPRIKVEGGDAQWLFPQLLRGGLDGWRLIDRVLWRLQASGRG